MFLATCPYCSQFMTKIENIVFCQKCYHTSENCHCNNCKRYISSDLNLKAIGAKQLTKEDMEIVDFLTFTLKPESPFKALDLCGSLGSNAQKGV